MEKISIQKTTAPKQKPSTEGLAFGTHFTDHMFLMNYEDGRGWYDPRIVPYGPFTLDPSCAVLHYAQEIFEGLKAYRSPKDEVLLFRPMENIKRLNASAKRMCIPEVPEDLVLSALLQLIDLDRDWVPGTPETSLYIRPFIIATDPCIGIYASHTYLFAIIACPVAGFYSHGLTPTKILIEDEEVRAVRGGTGAAKCGGNYAGSLKAGKKASEMGYSQVLWLDGIERKYIEEVGAMNIMFKIAGKIVTPQLTGSVLPGITRKSCIEILKNHGYEVSEQLITIDELIEAAQNGQLEEAFGTGTAAVISPISEFSYQGISYPVADKSLGPVTKQLYEELTGIQCGTREDSYHWTITVGK